jgi:hypothetical protein
MTALGSFLAPGRGIWRNIKRSQAHTISPKAGLKKESHLSEFIMSIASVTIKKQPSG